MYQRIKLCALGGRKLQREMNRNCPTCGSYPYEGPETRPITEIAPALMCRVVEWAKGHIPNDGKLRYALYCGLIDEFEKLGCYELEECCRLDEQFKEAWEDTHHWEPECD